MLSAEIVLGFIKRNRLYFFMLIFVIMVNIFSVGHEKKESPDAKKIRTVMSKDEIEAQEKRIKRVLSENKPLARLLTASAFFGATVLMLGLILGMRCLALKLNDRSVMVAYGTPPDVGWGILDLFRTAVLLFFLGYLLQLLEATAAFLMGIKDLNSKLLIVTHATMMDLVAISIVIYFVIKKYKGTLLSLGISFKNFVRDIRIGIGGYVAILPVLVLVMLIVIVFLQVVRYEQPPSPIFEILYGETQPNLLFVLTILLTFLGPVSEELFFRGFAYPVLRKRLGVKKAILLVSAVFALLHMNFISFFPVFVLGILLAYLYEKTGSLISPIVVHMIHNSSVVFFVYLYKLITYPG